MNYKIKIHGTEYEVNIHKVEDNIAHLTVNEMDFEVEVEELNINPTRMSHSPATKTVQPDVALGKQQTANSILEVRSPLPGIINKVRVVEGDKVKAGQELLILEAMKMENSIEADREGVIEKVNCREGDSVLEGDVLLIIK